MKDYCCKCYNKKEAHRDETNRCEYINDYFEEFKNILSVDRDDFDLRKVETVSDYSQTHEYPSRYYSFKIIMCSGCIIKSELMSQDEARQRRGDFVKMWKDCVGET